MGWGDQARPGPKKHGALERAPSYRKAVCACTSKIWNRLGPLWPEVGTIARIRLDQFGPIFTKTLLRPCCLSEIIQIFTKQCIAGRMQLHHERGRRSIWAVTARVLEPHVTGDKIDILIFDPSRKVGTSTPPRIVGKTQYQIEHFQPKPQIRMGNISHCSSWKQLAAHSSCSAKHTAEGPQRLPVNIRRYNSTRSKMRLSCPKNL